MPQSRRSTAEESSLIWSAQRTMVLGTRERDSKAAPLLAVTVHEAADPALGDPSRASAHVLGHSDLSSIDLLLREARAGLAVGHVSVRLQSVEQIH